VRTLRVALAQVNPIVGDLEANAATVVEYGRRARDLGADLVAFPELMITGYPPEDLLLRKKFIDDNLRVLEGTLGEIRDITAIIGFVDQNDDIYNAAAVVHGGRVAGVYHKQYLPNYGVFDEVRYFRAGDDPQVFRIAGARVGVSICEDIWYPGGPAQAQALAGAEVIVNINGSPFHKGKRLFRERMLATRASDYAVALCYVNMVGGQDELVFDGNSMAFDPYGELIAHAPSFEEHLLIFDIDLEAVYQARLHDPRRRAERASAPRSVSLVEVSDARVGGRPPLTDRPLSEPLKDEAEVYAALVLGTRDYVHKNGFETVIVGMSGGIDSSLVAAIATDALGPGHVVGVSNPSRYSSEGSIADAQHLAANLGIRLLIIPIEPAHAAYLEMLAPQFAGTSPGTAEENVQSRIRGNIWMALSNKFGWQPVLTAGNKSEIACGYATLYGDMAGGFAVIKDVPKTLVYRLARYRNARAGREIIPQAVLTKAPSAELKPGQLDTDTLPPYDILDPIIEAYVEDDRSVEDIVARGFEEATVKRVIAMVDRNEYKRRQAAPGIKITPRAFGRDRRLPITNHYRNW
jgi:NAD+ synthase (glutamine-hydrolysing)